MSSETKMPDNISERRCGECSLCCKLAQVDELDKPSGVWCRHCAPGRGGCTIYETRPDVCGNWFCNWIVDSRLGPEWYPLTSKMILFSEKARSRRCGPVEPRHADVSRREPYYDHVNQLMAPAV